MPGAVPSPPAWSLLMIAASLALLPASSTADASRASIDSLNSLGRGYLFAKVEHSVKLYESVAEDARKLRYPLGEARALQNLGIALYLAGDYERGVAASLEAIRLFEELHMDHELAMSYGELGYQMKRRDLPRGLSFMQQGMGIAESSRDTLALCTLYDNYGVLQEMDERPDNAIEYYRRALDLKLASNDSLGIPFSLNHLAGIDAQQGRFEEAEALLRRSDMVRRAIHDKHGLLENSLQWAELKFLQGDLDTAAENVERALEDPGIHEEIYMLSYCYQQLATIYESKHDYERAYRNHLQYIAYRDSLSNVESNARMAKLELEYETERKDRLLAESRLAVAARSRQIVFLTGVLVLVLVVTLAIMRAQQLKRRQLKQEMEWRGRLRRSEYERKLADEKVRISRELHDNIGSRLTFITSSIDNLSRQSGGNQLRGGLDSLADFGRRTLTELRQTVWAMKSEDEGFRALQQKLQDLKRLCSGSGRSLELTTTRDADSAFSLSSSRMLNVFRIAQEAVQNAVKHTREGTIELELTQDSLGLVLTVRDHGPGFDPEEVRHSGGIIHMRERCKESGGSFRLASGPNGTTILCRFPPE